MVRFIVVGRRTWRVTLTLAILLGLGTWAFVGDLTRPSLVPDQVRSAWEGARRWVVGLLPGRAPAGDGSPSAVVGTEGGEDAAAAPVPPADAREAGSGASGEPALPLPPAPDEIGVVTATETGLDLAAGSGYDLYRLDRGRVRSERMELLRQVLADTTAGESRRADAQQALLQELGHLEQELAIENLLRIQGYEGAVAILGPEGVEVVLTHVLDSEQARRLGGLVASVAGVGIQQVTLVDGLTAVR